MDVHQAASQRLRHAVGSVVTGASQQSMATPLRDAVWGLCPGCGRWQVDVASELSSGGPETTSDTQIAALVNEAFREHARVECPGLAELIAVRGMNARPSPMFP